jgi:acetyl-CoA carboxylase carboxyl transferase subunit beta
MVVYARRWQREYQVCPECVRHHPVTARDRIGQVLDKGSIRWLDYDVASTDVLGFVDTKPYPQRLATARAATGMADAALVAQGTVSGHPLIVVAMDFRFMGGSLGRAVGTLVTSAAETALVERVPLLIVSASGGARMQEGALSLMQMAKTAAALGRLDDAGVLTISLLTDPVYGGVAASYATLCDVILAEPGARFGFAGRRVIAQTVRQDLPADFQTAEFLLAHGLVDGIVPRRQLRDRLTALLAISTATGSPDDNPDNSPAEEGSAIVRDPGLLAESVVWEHVRRARDLARPTMRDHLANAFDGFVELRGDRAGGDCPAVIAGLARLGSIGVVVVGTQKGHTPAELTKHNFGMPAPAGYRKAARAMRLAAKLGLPVVSLVDTPGAYPGAEAEQRGQALAIAENLRLMAGLPVPVVSVITGEGGSGGALALAVANRVLIFADGVYSVISPEGCAAILWHDATAARQAAAALRLTPRDLLRLRVVDGVVTEPPGSAGADPVGASARLRAALLESLTELIRMDPVALRADRWARFHEFGTPDSADVPIPAQSEEAK